MLFSKEEKTKIATELRKAKVLRIGEVFQLIEKQGSSRSDVFALFYQLVAEAKDSKKPLFTLQSPKPYTIYGEDLIDPNAIKDMDFMMRLPHTIGGAIMPDGHRVKENSAPVGTVLVLDGHINPFVVGNDISCSVSYTATKTKAISFTEDQMADALTLLTKFGYESNDSDFQMPVILHNELSRLDSVLTTTIAKKALSQIKSIADKQFATCGNGNHFVELGVNNQGMFSILSHFGSRRVGAIIAKAFCNGALNMYDMPKGVKTASIPIDSDLGKDYIEMMGFAGMYAEWGHVMVHSNIMDRLLGDKGNNVQNSVYTRHNYAWIQDDNTVIHRKGSTPVDARIQSVIPATMGHKSKIVIGEDDPKSYNSASHGAGRKFSRTQAIELYGHLDVHDHLYSEYSVTLLGGGHDELPESYKNIDDVMKRQPHIKIVDEFQPLVVRMSEPKIPQWKKNK